MPAPRPPADERGGVIVIRFLVAQPRETVMESANKKPYIIVVGVDYSEVSDLALERAFELASLQPNGEVHAVSVIRTQGDSAFLEAHDGLTVISMHEAAERVRDYVQQKFDHFVRQPGGNAGALCKRVVTHLRFESPAMEIAQLASDLEAELVVVGTHGYRGVRRLLLGSVAEATVRLSPTAVLVVRPKHIASENFPQIEPPCPRCVEARRASGGKQLWCEQHLERHGRRHTYHYLDRNTASHENMPIFTPEER